MQQEEPQPPPADAGPDGEPTRAPPSPTPPPPADAPAPDPAAEGARSESAEGGREGSAGGPCAGGATRPAPGDPAGSAAGTPGGPQPEGLGRRGEDRMRSVATQTSKQEAAVSHHSEEMEGVKEQARVLPEEMEEVPALQEEISVGQIKTCSQDSAQKPSSSQRDPGGQLKGDSASPPAKTSKQEAAVSHHSEEMEGVKEQACVLPEEMEEVPALQERISVGQIKTCSQDSVQKPSSFQRDPGGQLKGDSASPPLKVNNQEVSHLQEEIQGLKEQLRLLQEVVSSLTQKVEKLENSQGASGLQMMPPQRSITRSPSLFGGSTPVKVFSAQFQTTGKTDGCERKFLEDVSNHLSKQSISLKAKEFTETSSKDLLLVFCPIASRMGTDIKNALEGLNGEQKVLLVVMHYVRMDITEISVDPKQQVSHPALVQTVHTRYTLQDGVYPCKMNQRAMADVVAAIKKLAEDH